MREPVSEGVGEGVGGWPSERVSTGGTERGSKPGSEGAGERARGTGVGSEVAGAGEAVWPGRLLGHCSIVIAC